MPEDKLAYLKELLADDSVPTEVVEAYLDMAEGHVPTALMLIRNSYRVEDV